MKITDKIIKASCSPTIYQRGAEYFREGRVHLRKREETHITAAVDDESIFKVDVEFNENGITKSFCTCPYYQTMHSPCKHIIAAMRQRQKEIDEGGNFADTNDKIAGELCRVFAFEEMPKTQLNARFTMNIKRAKSNVTYSMVIEIDGVDGEIDGIDNFLECYIKGREFKFDKNTTYIPHVTEFPKPQAEILKILAGAYLDRSADLSMYTKAVYRTTFSAAAAMRIFPHIVHTDFTIMVDEIKCQNVIFLEEDPDIMIDIDATDTDITMSVADRGLALTDGGEWFMYENVIYHTSEEWRGFFMPIYNAVISENRMQITFKGDNRLLFVKHVLPKIKDMRSVIVQGFEDLIVDSVPQFKIYIDAAGASVTAVIIVQYGSVKIRLMQESETDKIIVRDSKAEDKVVSVFRDFEYSDGTFMLNNDDMVFDFAKNGVKELSQIAELYLSESFKNLFTTENITVTAAVDYNVEIDLLETGFKTNLSKDELWRILSAVRLKKQYYRLPNGHFLDFADGDNMEMLKLLHYLDFSREEINSGHKSINKYYALYFESLQGIEKSDRFKRLISNMRSVDAQIPEELNNVLRGYQKNGIIWLKQLSYLGFGGILADDMGLGKTLQVLAYIHGEKPGTPTLIITPSALMYNWINEIKRFIPDASALVVDGTKSDRAELIKTISSYEFVITSYPLLRRDIMLYRNKEFEYMFIDEAQHIKNPKTMNAHAVKRIKARYKFAVTGTPIENSLSELWSVFDFIMPGYLYNLNEFREKYENPIMRGADSSCAMELRMKIKPFIMRRMKNEVLKELPEKIEETIYADLTQPQKNMYSAFLEVARMDTAAALAEGGRGRMRILTLLMRLRQICCHPSLFDENYIKDSGKLNLLMELVANGIDGGHRILIFSQFTSMLSIISSELKKREISHFYLDGKTPPEDRAAMSERFNGGENDVFLISLKAGGTGLNLTGADMVIHYDPWWNPAVTDQASDRAYRIGQTRAVQIIKLASRGTIEEKILRLQEAKRSLADDIIKTNNSVLSSLSDDEIMSLFS